MLSETSLLGLQTAAFSLCLHIGFPLCVCVLISSSYKDPTHIELGLTHMTSFYLHYLFKGPHLQIQSHSQVLGVRSSTYDLRGAGNTIKSITTSEGMMLELGLFERVRSRLAQ